MLRSSIPAITPEIQRLIDDIINEETRFMMSERRDATRKPITRGVIIQPCNEPGQQFSAISRDVSNQGIGLISQREWKDGDTAKIEINRLKGPASIVVAECRWCDKFAEGWFVSGWNFKRLERS